MSTLRQSTGASLSSASTPRPRDRARCFSPGVSGAASSTSAAWSGALRGASLRRSASIAPASWRRRHRQPCRPLRVASGGLGWSPRCARRCCAWPTGPARWPQLPLPRPRDHARRDQPASHAGQHPADDVTSAMMPGSIQTTRRVHGTRRHRPDVVPARRSSSSAFLGESFGTQARAISADPPGAEERDRATR